MFKKILISLFVLFSVFFTTFFLGNNTQAGIIKVENIFTDINSDYEYLNELQTLYDRGMIFPDSEGKFNPRALLNRDEFVGILMEVTCKKCIQPDTTIDLINKYSSNQVFYDINKSNKYFYCVEEANDSGFVKGYDPGSTCENGVTKDGEKPYCPSNTIILEEAIAVVLRASGILTNDEAEKVRQDIYNGIITEDIADDVSPKNLDGSVYSFYPDLAKALNYEVTEVDLDGNIKTYKLIEKKGGKLRPKQAISKEDFLRIAYVALKANACGKKEENNIALEMNVFEKQCNESDKNCVLSDLIDVNNTYDFGNNLYTTCEESVKDPDGYIWRFYNNNNGNQIIKYGSYLNDYKFLSNGKWTVFLRVIDNCGNTAEVYNTINVGNPNENIDLKVSIDADPIYGEGPLLVNFEGIVEGGVGPYSYFWDFGDGNNGYGKDIKNIFKEQGIYEVLLTVTDSTGKIVTATVLIQVIGENCNIDSDNDGVNNCDDVLPLVPGDKRNKGAPILERECNTNNDCREGYVCTTDTYVCLPKELSVSCEYSGGDILFGNVSCNTCPCNISLDFTSTLRKCDIIFPAITSPDSTNIYGKGGLFQIK